MILMLCPHHVMLWLWLLLLLLLLQTCRQTEALLAASTAQVLEIQTGVWPHAEETKVSPSCPPVPSNNDGSPPKTDTAGTVQNTSDDFRSVLPYHP
jgi:hypothetical protein